jgi:hypothetical protein
MANAAPKKTSSRDKVRAYRARMRAQGLRPVQIWIPDTRTPEFIAEARRQSLLIGTHPDEPEEQAWVDSMKDEDPFGAGDA